MVDKKKEIEVTEEIQTEGMSRRKFMTGALAAGTVAAGGLLNAAPALASGDVTLKVNGAKVAADVAPFIKDGRTMVPIRFVAEALQTDVGWDAANRTATVDAKELTFPYTKKLDPEKAREAGYAAYFAGGSCMYGSGYGLLSVLREEIGFPWTTMPANAFYYGLGGALELSLCGAQNGALLVMGMILGNGDDMKAIMKALNAYYKETELPLDEKHTAWSKYTTVKTVSPSVNCGDSRGTWCETTGFAVGDPERADRCAKLSGDIAAKAIELLNAHFGF